MPVEDWALRMHPEDRDSVAAFCVAQSQAGADVARKVAERCQRLAQKQAIAHTQSPHGQHITVGVGVGTAMAGGLESMTPSDFIDTVDRPALCRHGGPKCPPLERRQPHQHQLLGADSLHMPRQRLEALLRWQSSPVDPVHLPPDLQQLHIAQDVFFA